MTQKERGQIEQLQDRVYSLEDKLSDVNTTMEKIVMLLNDDSYSSNKGLISRMNFIEETVYRLKNFMYNAKWVIATLAVPIIIEVVKKLVKGIENGFTL